MGGGVVFDEKIVLFTRKREKRRKKKQCLSTYIHLFSFKSNMTRPLKKCTRHGNVSCRIDGKRAAGKKFGGMVGKKKEKKISGFPP